MNKVACFTHISDNWRTPSNLYNYLIHEKGYIDLFPYCSSYDQYGITDIRNKLLFINPPYSHLNTKKFRDYISLLLNNDNVIALLIPSRTDTKIFHFLSLYLDILIFFKGRLHFNDSKCAPFPSCLMILSNSQTSWYNPTIRFCSVEEYIHGSSNSKN